MTYTIDIFKPFWAVAVVLLAVGVIHFTPAAVAILLLTSQFQFTVTWQK